MSFSPPSSYSSQATTGYQCQFLMGTVASPISYVPVLEVKSIKPDYYSVPEINVTHLLSPNLTEELRPGFLKPGSVSISGNFIGDATQLNITSVAQAQDIFGWKITAPVQNSSKTYTASGLGYIMKYAPGPMEINKAIEYEFSLQITGPVTETVA